MLHTTDRHMRSRTGQHFRRDRRAIEFERKRHDELRARMEQTEKSFAVSSHADNEQTDVNLPTVEPFRLGG